MTSLVNRFLRWIDEKRAGDVVDILKPHGRGATLDVGCWNGDVAKRLGLDQIIGIAVTRCIRKFGYGKNRNKRKWLTPFVLHTYFCVLDFYKRLRFGS